MITTTRLISLLFPFLTILRYSPFTAKQGNQSQKSCHDIFKKQITLFLSSTSSAPLYMRYYVHTTLANRSNRRSSSPNFPLLLLPLVVTFHSFIVEGKMEIRRGPGAFKACLVKAKPLSIHRDEVM